MKEILARLQSELRLDAKHQYWLGERKLPSVTQVLRNLSKDALVPWAAKLQQQADLDAIRAALPIVSDPAPILAPVAHAWKKSRDKAADLGTEVHAMIEAECRQMLGLDVTWPKVSDKARVVFAGWEEWAEKAGLQPVAIEQRVYDSGLDVPVFRGYAGTLDLMCYLKTYGEELWVLDWKSNDSEGLYPEYELQNMAYRSALQFHGIEARGMIVKLPKNGPDLTIKGYEVPWSNEAMSAFNGLLDVHAFIQGRKK